MVDEMPYFHLFPDLGGCHNTHPQSKHAVEVHLGTVPLEVQGSDVMPIKQHTATQRIIEALKQCHLELWSKFYWFLHFKTMTKATRVGCSNVLQCDAPIISSKPQETLPIRSSDTCALAAATRSNQGSGGTRLHNETQTIKNRRFGRVA